MDVPGKPAVRLLDVLNAMGAFGALVLSIVSLFYATANERRVQRQNVFEAFHFGFNSTDLYVLSALGRLGTNAISGPDPDIPKVTLVAQQYALALNIPPDTFTHFAETIKAAPSYEIANDIGIVEPTLLRTCSRSCVAAYNLAWLLRLAESPRTVNGNDPLLRAWDSSAQSLNEDLRLMGVDYRFPDGIVDRDGLIKAIVKAVAEIEKLGGA